MTQVTPVNIAKQESLPRVSSLDLMRLILKINAQFEKTSSDASSLKKEHLSIFEHQSSLQKSSKFKESVSVFSIALLTAGAQFTSGLSQGGIGSALKIAEKALPYFSQGTTSLFQAYESSFVSKKYISQIESDANRDAGSKMDQLVQSNLDKISTLMKQNDALTHLR